MNRMAWLQERRMEKFEDVLGRFEARRLSAMDAAELVGMSERTFRRYRRRMSRTVFSAGSLARVDFCLIFVPFGHCDEPEILPYENASACPTGADVRHFEDVTDHLITRAMGSDGDDSTIGRR